MKILKNYLIKLVIGLCLPLFAVAQSVDVSVDPTEAIVNESFYVTFKVKITGSESPYINFTPVNASVLGKREASTSISTVIINGKYSVTKEQTYVYELISERTGTAYIKDIVVNLNGVNSKLKDLKVNIISEKRKLQDVFLEAIPSKRKVFVGEGIDVNYYLFYKVPVIANDVKEFPKLNKFIKRFYKTTGNVETVQYRGEVFRRVLAYSARAYPEKPGVAVLDTMKISAQVADQRSFDPFGGLSNSYRQKDISSPRVEIDVLPIPVDKMPTNFSGLVGQHEFNLTGGKAKYLINEPIEFKLEVKGPGALENFQAPSLFNSDLIESFDTKSDMVEVSEGVAVKKFDFTFLARSSVNIEERELSFSVFDPEKEIFIEKIIKIPAIAVFGSAEPSKSGDKNTQNRLNKKEKKIDLNFDFSLLPSWLLPVNGDKNNKVGLVGVGDFTASTKMDLVFWFFAVVLFIISIFLIYKGLKSDQISDEKLYIFDKQFKKFKKNPSYENLYLLLLILLKNRSNGLVDELKELSVKKESINYALSLLKTLEEAEYSNRPKNISSRKIEYGHLKVLRRILKEKHEGN